MLSQAMAPEASLAVLTAGGFGLDALPHSPLSPMCPHSWPWELCRVGVHEGGTLSYSMLTPGSQP